MFYKEEVCEDLQLTSIDARACEWSFSILAYLWCGHTHKYAYSAFSSMFQTINLILASKQRQIVWDMTQQLSKKKNGPQ